MNREQLKILLQTNPEGLIDIVLQLWERVQKLEAMLQKNSQNSGKPPSSDGLNKPPRTKSSRSPSGKEPGGQEGHAPHLLKKVSLPDLTIFHTASRCSCCGLDLQDATIVEETERQVFDLPKLAITVTAHVRQTSSCPNCAALNAGSFPVEVSRPTQYGPNVSAQIVYFMAYQMLPFKRLRELFTDLYGHRISAGTFGNILKRYHEGLSGFEVMVRQKLIEADVLHADETGVSVNGSNSWCHSYSTPTDTLYLIHPNRGTKAMEFHGILPEFKGTLVHDFWKAYFAYLCSHALCNAHLLRELRFEFEVMKQPWARLMTILLLRLKRQIENLKKDTASWYIRAVRRYERIVAMGMKKNPAPSHIPGRRGRTKKSTTRNLLERFADHREEILRFACQRNVPFDNNLAERDIRMVKLKQKISGGFRSPTGAAYFFRIRAYISTVRKRGKMVLESLRHVLSGGAELVFTG